MFGMYFILLSCLLLFFILYSYIEEVLGINLTSLAMAEIIFFKIMSD